MVLKQTSISIMSLSKPRWLRYFVFSRHPTPQSVPLSNVSLDNKIVHLCSLARIFDMMDRIYWLKKTLSKAITIIFAFTLTLTRTRFSLTLRMSSSTMNQLQITQMLPQLSKVFRLQDKWRLSLIKQWTLILTWISWDLIIIHIQPHQVEFWRRTKLRRTISKSMFLLMVIGPKEARKPSGNHGEPNHSSKTNWSWTLTLLILNLFLLTRSKISFN